MTERSKRKSNPKTEPIYNDKGKEICGAHSKRANKVCQSTALMAGKRCYMHGGNTPRGIASANFKDGKHSKLLPKNLRDKYNEAINDEKLIQLRSEIALAEVRRQDLMIELNKGNYGETLKGLKVLFKKAEDMKASGDLTSIAFLMPRIKELLDSSESADATWNKLMEVEDHKRKLIESETKRMLSAGQMLTMEGTIILMNQIGNLIKEVITDKESLRKVSTGLQKLMGGVE